MKTVPHRLSRLAAILALFTIAALTGLSQVKFGSKSGFITNYQWSLIVEIPENADPRQPHFLKNTGGGLFVSIAKPASEADAGPISLRYEAESPDGQRLVVRIKDSPALVYRVHDWILSPTAEFVDSGAQGVISMSDPETTGELLDSKERKLLAAARRLHPNIDYVIRLHPAFLNTALGLRMIQADAVFSGFYSQRFLPTENGRLVIEAGEPEQASADTVAAAEARMERKIATASTWIVLTDVARPFTFQVDDRSSPRFMLAGSLRYLTWKEGASGEFVLGNDNLNDLWKDFADVNPLVYAAVNKTARLAAFLRYVKAKHPTDWKRFVIELRTKAKVKRVETPGLLLAGAQP